jgi:hypothetical protein
MQYIKIHSLDNVAVALADLAEAQVVIDGHDSASSGSGTRT